MNAKVNDDSTSNDIKIWLVILQFDSILQQHSLLVLGGFINASFINNTFFEINNYFLNKINFF